MLRSTLGDTVTRRATAAEYLGQSCESSANAASGSGDSMIKLAAFKLISEDTVSLLLEFNYTNKIRRLT